LYINNYSETKIKLNIKNFFPTPRIKPISIIKAYRWTPNREIITFILLWF